MQQQQVNGRLRMAGHPPVGHKQVITNEWEVAGRWNEAVNRPTDEQVGYFREGYHENA